MELLLGSHVREHGNRVGRLAGFELESAGLKIRRIIFSPDGELGPQTSTRPLAAIALVHDDGEVELRVDVSIDALPPVSDVQLLAHSTRLRQNDRERGRLAGLDVNPADRTVVSVFGRLHWWSRRFSVVAKSADFSAPGEIRLSSSGSRAA
jgi:hypothetical protein